MARSHDDEPWHPRTRSNAALVAFARTKSYTGPAIVTMLLYLVAWLPGFVANLLYWDEGRRMERIAGHELPGMGCLRLMLWLNVLYVLVVGLLLVLVF